MSNTNSGLPFPSGGKILVINMSLPRKEQLRFGSRVHWMNSWEFLGTRSLPDGVVGVILPYAMKKDAENTIKTWARKNGIKDDQIHVEHSSNQLEKNLKGYFDGGFSVGGNGNGVDDSESGVIVRRPIPAHLLRSPGPVSIPSAPRKWEGEFLVKTKRVRPLKGQPRTYFSSKKMLELMTSIKAIGQVTAIIVRPIDDDPDFDYELIEGERRLRSCLKLGIEEMLATVREVKDSEDQFKKSFVANFAREGHTPLETARSIQRMLGFPEYADLSKTAALRIVASLTGKTDMWAYNYLKLLNLPKEVQDMLEPDDDDRSALPQAMGMFLASIESREIQLKVCKDAVEKGLSVAKAKHLARQLASAAGIRVGSPGRSPVEDYRILCNYLRKANENLEHLVDMPHRAIDELFQNRPLEDRQKVLKEIDDLAEKLTMLRDQVDLRTAVRSR